MALKLVLVTTGVAVALAIATPAPAAQIVLGPRGNCNCYLDGSGLDWCYCYFRGTVTFTNPANQLQQVDCWVTNQYAGTQNNGFNHTPGTAVWDYAQCCNLQPRMSFTGPYETTDAAYMVGQQWFPIASGQRNWFP